MTAHAVSRYVPLLIEGDIDGLLELFGNEPRINDPRLGWIEGDLFEPFVAASFAALAQRSARVEHLATTRSPLGAVEECTLILVRRQGTVRLPVAIAAVTSSETLASIHIYHSMWPLMRAHAIRAPILPALAALVLPDVVGRYHESVERGDVSGAVRQFDPGGELREPTGDPDVHRGSHKLREFFGKALSRGGISLERCTLTDDGTSCALEYNLTAWGGVVLPRQAGIAVYQRARTGLLAAARIYDDVDPPLGGSIS